MHSILAYPSICVMTLLDLTWNHFSIFSSFFTDIYLIWWPAERRSMADSKASAVSPVSAGKSRPAPVQLFEIGCHSVDWPLGKRWHKMHNNINIYKNRRIYLNIIKMNQIDRSLEIGVNYEILGAMLPPRSRPMRSSCAPKRPEPRRSKRRKATLWNGRAS